MGNLLLALKLTPKVREVFDRANLRTDTVDFDYDEFPF